MNIIREIYLKGCFSLAMAAAFAAIPVTADAEEKAQGGREV
ncbi:hypothetical protein RCO48_15975 [Peribacillus frigoritolerans]|nr:hypothetical protein [Peribacillus frigoritolerans]